tara:strand:- start:2401 stop:2880 length:480 start_codon:yes stop_codon:yes gene_type:complete
MWEAEGSARGGWPGNDHHHYDNGGHSHTGGAAPYIYDMFAECWLMADDGYYATYGWYFEAVIDYPYNDFEQIDEVWLDVYDGYGLLFSQLMHDSVDYGGWLKPPAAAAFGYRTGHHDGVFMYANSDQNINLKCDGSAIYDVYITVYDVYGNSDSVVQSL